MELKSDASVTSIHEAMKIYEAEKHQKLMELQERILLETKSAMMQYEPMYTPLHGLAVLEEEVDELKIEIRRKDRTEEAIRKEAIQVAAMALRFLYDLPEMIKRGIRNG